MNNNHAVKNLVKSLEKRSFSVCIYFCYESTWNNGEDSMKKLLSNWNGRKPWEEEARFLDLDWVDGVFCVAVASVDAVSSTDVSAGERVAVSAKPPDGANVSSDAVNVLVGVKVGKAGISSFCSRAQERSILAISVSGSMPSGTKWRFSRYACLSVVHAFRAANTVTAASAVWSCTMSFFVRQPRYRCLMFY